MRSKIEIHGKPVSVEWSEAADAALSRRSTPLLAEMELYFSCLIRKAVRFGDDVHGTAFVPAGLHLQVGFRPVQTRNCRISELPQGAAAPLDDLPIVRPGRFVPNWLRIDYRGGQWRGEFGF